MAALSGFRLIGAALVLATLAAGVAEWRDGAAGSPRAAPAGAPALPGAGTGPVAGSPLLLAPPDAAPAPAPGPAAPSHNAAVVVPGGDPARLFADKLKAARETPQPAPAPQIAQARSFGEAFEAMRDAQREPPTPLVGANPFGPQAK